MTQFAVIRRAFHLTFNEAGIEANFENIIDLSETLNDEECTLHDLQKVYEIFHNQSPGITIHQISRCDKIIAKMGFDKQWAQYFHNSRKDLPD